MSTIPTSLTEKQFNDHILPYLSTAKRGYVCKIALYKVFNYILYHKRAPRRPAPGCWAFRLNTATPVIEVRYISSPVSGSMPVISSPLRKRSIVDWM